MSYNEEEEGELKQRKFTTFLYKDNLIDNLVVCA